MRRSRARSTCRTAAQVDAAVERTRAELGPVLVLVNNAAKDGFDAFMDISPELWERIIAVNLTGTFHCTQSALPDMLEAEVGPHRQHLVVERGRPARRGWRTTRRRRAA